MLVSSDKSATKRTMQNSSSCRRHNVSSQHHNVNQIKSRSRQWFNSGHGSALPAHTSAPGNAPNAGFVNVVDLTFDSDACGAAGFRPRVVPTYCGYDVIDTLSCVSTRNWRNLPLLSRPPSLKYTNASVQHTNGSKDTAPGHRDNQTSLYTEERSKNTEQSFRMVCAMPKQRGVHKRPLGYIGSSRRQHNRLSHDAG